MVPDRSYRLQMDKVLEFEQEIGDKLTELLNRRDISGKAAMEELRPLVERFVDWRAEYARLHAQLSTVTIGELRSMREAGLI